VAYDISLFKGALIFIVMASYVAAFAGFLEYFRLSRFRRQRMFLVMCLSAWWVFCPWILGLASRFSGHEHLWMISPLTGVFKGAEALTASSTAIPLIQILPAVAVAVLMWVLAIQEGRIVKAAALAEPGAGSKA
jgi:hypothetical protein